MNRYFHALVAVLALTAFGCSDRIAGYTAAASISANGFTRNGPLAAAESGQEARVWGYVDPLNLYGDPGVKEVLGDWWSGAGPGPGSWQFNLKAHEADAAGHSFAVIVPNDPDRDPLLRVFLEDAVAQRPTKVFITGRIFTYPAPANFSSRVGLYMELESSRDIQFRPERTRK